MLLQIVRQPTEDEMRQFVGRIKEQGLTRDDARLARQGRAQKTKPFVFRHSSKNQSWLLTLKFRKSQAGREEIREALLEAAKSLEDQ